MQKNVAGRATTVAARRTAATTASPQASAAAAGHHPKLWELPRRELLIVCGIFAITGSSAAAFVRPALRFIALSTPVGALLGLDETSGFIAGPWTFRVLYFLIMWPMYSMLLLFFGTVFGRGPFFRPFIVKMWSRVLPKPAAAKLKRALTG
jgi:hypothetical protein